MPPNLIKPTKTKAQIRQELEREVNQYLSQGGKVNNIPTGLSGNESNKNLFSQSAQFEPKQARTSVTGVVKELEARKHQMKEPKVKPKGPSKKLITDDFGEPIRWVWDDK